MRPLHDRYDGLKTLEFPLFYLKIRSIALLLISFLSKTGEITLFFISPYSHAKVSYKTSGLAPEFLALYYKKC